MHGTGIQFHAERIGLGNIEQNLFHLFLRYDVLPDVGEELTAFFYLFTAAECRFQNIVIGIVNILFRIVQRCGDKAGEVQALADYLDFGDDVTAYKEEMIQSYFEELPMKTEEEALAAKEKLEAYCASLGYDGEEKEELFEEIRDRLEELDRIYRTVDGIVCGTRESADFAREELPQIQEFMAHTQRLHRILCWTMNGRSMTS